MNKQQIEDSMRACAARLIAEELKVDPNHRGTANLAKALGHTFVSSYRIDTDWNTESAADLADNRTGEVPVLVIRIQIDIVPALDQTALSTNAEPAPQDVQPFDLSEADLEFSQDELETVARCADWLRGQAHPLRFVGRDDEPAITARRNWQSATRVHSGRR